MEYTTLRGGSTGDIDNCSTGSMSEGSILLTLRVFAVWTVFRGSVLRALPVVQFKYCDTAATADTRQYVVWADTASTT